MQDFVNLVSTVASELLTLLILALVGFLLSKAEQYLDRLKKKDELGIIDMITDRVVEYAEAELKGAKGIEKRDFAVDKAIQILADKGIKVEKAEVIAGIENGVTKMKMNKGFMTPFQNDNSFLQ